MRCGDRTISARSSRIRNYDGRDNLVVGGDLSVKPSSTQSLSATFLASQHRPIATTADAQRQRGAGVVRATRRAASTSARQVEHYDRDFQMDTAFYNRTGFTAGWSFGEVNFYPEVGHRLLAAARAPVRTSPRSATTRSRTADEDFLQHRHPLQLHAPGLLEHLARRAATRPWHGHAIPRRQRLQLFGDDAGVALAEHLRRLRSRARRSSTTRSIRSRGARCTRNFGFDDPAEPAPDAEHRRATCVALRSRSRPASASTTSTSSTRRRRISSTSTSWCASSRNYDSSAQRVLTDLLASYELVPGTVFHAGYGSLYEKDVAVL